MRLGLLAAPLLTLSLACSFSSQGEPDVGNDDELAGPTSETAFEGSGEEIGTEQGTSAESTGDGDGDPSTTTGDGDGDPSTTTETTTDTTDTSTDATDTSTDTTETTTDTTDTSTDTTTGDTGMMETYYGDCPNGGQDCALGEVCKEDADLLEDWQVCAIPCDNSGDCPLVEGFSLTCISYAFQDKACHIACDNNDPCPLGMSCKAVNVGFDHICAW